jgi:hypothetical protein
VKRVPPSAANVHEIFDFLCSIGDIEVLGDTSDLETLLNDLEYLDNVSDSKLFHKKSSTVARAKSRRWYKANKARVKKLQQKIKISKAAAAKKKIMAKSDRSPIKKKQRKRNHTKSHVNEKRLKRGAQKIVNSWFRPHEYKIIRPFTINENIDARINEDILHYGNDNYELIQKDGRRFKLEINRGVIGQFIKLKSLVTVDDFT